MSFTVFAYKNNTSPDIKGPEVFEVLEAIKTAINLLKTTTNHQARMDWSLNIQIIY